MNDAVREVPRTVADPSSVEDDLPYIEDGQAPAPLVSWMDEIEDDLDIGLGLWRRPDVGGPFGRKGTSEEMAEALDALWERVDELDERNCRLRGRRYRVERQLDKALGLIESARRELEKEDEEDEDED